MAYATLEELEARRGVLTTDEREKAAALLDDAAVILDGLVTIDGSEEQETLLMIVSCNMVSRALSTTPDAYGVSSLSTTAGVYSESLQYANPSGDMYLTKLEKRLLGVTTSYIGYIQPIIGVHDD